MRTLIKLISFMFSRLFMVGLMLVTQIALITAIVFFFSQSGLYAYLFLHLLSFLVALSIVANTENPSYKITWIVSILIFPLIGGVFYLILGNRRLSARLRESAGNAIEQTRAHMPDNSACEELLQPVSPMLAMQGRYIYNMSGYPVQRDYESVYFPLGEQMFEAMLSEMEKAERFIFLEYFIVSPGEMWSRVFALLQRKIAQGVEIRFLYDDFGTIRTLPKGYDRIIRAAGIKLCVFNPFRPRINVLLNNRDHRKVLVVDGHTAFCGGINIADEYINRIDRFGHWKDTGVMLKGPAVWSFTFMFLQLWEFASNRPVDFSRYPPPTPPPVPRKGAVQVFGDSPLDNANVTETAYLSIILRASRYVYITTPYLVIGYEMEAALCTAAKSGVDVRIITPFRYDKWYVHALTRSHYEKLLSAGVRVYEYSPGFMHGKTFVSDDCVCMVGTCNMDFRSFNLQFECSAAFYSSSTVLDVKNDFLACQSLSREIPLQEAANPTLRTKLIRTILKVFAPLM